MARASGTPLPRPNTMVDLSVDDNIFADMKGNRGSGASNTTKATSTDTSSRHSNASTAPSSADLGNGHEDQRNGRKTLQDIASRAAPKSSPASFLKNAGRTFSFGGAKKNSIPAPNNDPLPDVPSVPTIQREDVYGRARGMTSSTTSTATPPTLEGSNIDMGSDFGSMFSGSGFDKRASMATLRNDLMSSSTSSSTGTSTTVAPRSLTAHRSAQPAPLSLDKTTAVEPPPRSWNSQNSNDNLLASNIASPLADRPPPVPAHHTPFPPKSPNIPENIAEDEDSLLLQDTMAAGRYLSKSGDGARGSQPVRYTLEDNYSSVGRKPVTSGFGRDDDNMFDNTLSRGARMSHRPAAKSSGPSQNKVMTPAQFERYKQDKERHGSTDQPGQSTVTDDDEDEINYDDDEDEMEKSKQQAKQRRKQEAHMAVYRQQMMKVTGESGSTSPPPSNRPNLPTSLSAPHLNQLKAPSPDNTGVSDEDEDEEVPLAILQAHGFPNKNRPPTRLSTMGSNPNLRSSMLTPPSARPGTSFGENSSQAGGNQRHSTLPAFARHLPQDPFVGAGIAKPAVRESLAFGGGVQPPQGQQPAPMHPGGLVGVIASEERSRAMRRGSPNTDGQKLVGSATNGPHGPPGFDPIAGIPHQMMYGMGGPGGMGGMGGMAGMQGMQGMHMMPQQPPMMTVGDQAQLQMTQQMSQFMQMQMQFMQMMAVNQNGSPQMQQQPFLPPMGPMAGPPMSDFSARHSMVGDQSLAEPRRMDAGMRTMSMVQPSSASFMQQPGYAGSIHGGPAPGYTPSIAPSERSNIGLPGRYRPVSQSPAMAMPAQHQRANTMSGGLSVARWDETKRKSTMNVVTKASEGSDDDEQEGWEAMKAKREKKKTIWKSKKSFGSDLSAMIN